MVSTHSPPKKNPSTVWLKTLYIPLCTELDKRTHLKRQIKTKIPQPNSQLLELTGPADEVILGNWGDKAST
jgi:hypothetical protein